MVGVKYQTLDKKDDWSKQSYFGCVFILSLRKTLSHRYCSVYVVLLSCCWGVQWDRPVYVFCLVIWKVTLCFSVWSLYLFFLVLCWWLYFQPFSVRQEEQRGSAPRLQHEEALHACRSVNWSDSEEQEKRELRSSVTTSQKTWLPKPRQKAVE